MQFETFGPLVLPRGDDNLLNFDKNSRKSMWDEFENKTGALRIRDACGCYVFAIRASKGAVPWYIGKAERQAFKNECFDWHKIIYYNEVLSTTDSGTPILYFYARVTAALQVWSKPSASGYRDVDFLEDMLIGSAIRRNKHLLNVQKTSLLRNMIVPGFINSKPGRRSEATKALKQLVGY